MLELETMHLFNPNIRNFLFLEKTLA